MNKKILTFISVILISGICGFAIADSGGSAQKGMFFFSPYSHSSNLAETDAGTTIPSADGSISDTTETTGMSKKTKIALGIGAGLLAAGGIAAIIALSGGSSNNNPPTPPNSNLTILNAQSSGPLYSYTSSTMATADTNGQFSSGKVTIENTSGATMNELKATISKPPAGGTLTITGGTCSTSLANGVSCYFDYHYAAPASSVNSGNFTVYPATIKISYSGGSVDYNTDLYHVNKGHFINIPTNAPNYKKLANNHVNGIFVDSKGSIYAATDSGLSISSDGGKTFVNKTTTDGLGSNYVNAVFVDSVGKIYVATDGGLGISKDGGNIFETRGTTEGLGSDIVKGVYVGANGNIYAATYSSGLAGSGGLSISSDEGASFLNHSAGNDEVNGAYADATGKIYAATNGGLAVSFDGGNSFTTHTLTNNYVNGVYADAAGKVYAATKGGLSAGSCTSQSQCSFSPVSSLGSHSVWNVYVDSQGYIFTATENGLAISKNEGNSFTIKTTFDGLGDNSVRGIYVDSSGKIYAATHNGLSISDNIGAMFINQTTAASLGDSDVHGVYVDSAGKIYAATENGLSISSDGGASFTNKTTSDGLGNNTIENVTVTNGKIYAATSSGLSISEDGGISFINISPGENGIAGDYVGDVYVDANNTIYAGTEAGLSIGTCNTGVCSFTTHLTGLASNLISGVYVHNNTLYLATETEPSDSSKEGGFSFRPTDGTTFTNKTVENGGLADNSVNRVYVAANGTVYIATYGGLSVSWDGGNTFTNYTFDNEEPSKHVYGAYVDSAGKVYVATEKGLWLGACGTTANSCIFELPPNNPKTTDNGLGDYFVEGVYAANGKIYAATYGGLSVTQPQQ